MRKVATAVAGFVVLLMVSSAGAQMHPMKPAQPSQGQMPGAAQDPGAQPPQAMMRQGMMCPMMGQPMMGMGPGMMGGMSGMSDPQATARMLKLHGDMMKAMGEVMLKHGQAMEHEK